MSFNTAAFQIGGALGAAVITTVIVTHTSGTGHAALTGGFRAACALLAAIGLALFLAVPRVQDTGPVTVPERSRRGRPAPER
jgi:predicted MFS family arabinose efflux permease